MSEMNLPQSGGAAAGGVAFLDEIPDDVDDGDDAGAEGHAHDRAFGILETTAVDEKREKGEEESAVKMQAEQPTMRRVRKTSESWKNELLPWQGSPQRGVDRPDMVTL